jgi:hypothetical protein
METSVKVYRNAVLFVYITVPRGIVVEAHTGRKPLPIRVPKLRLNKVVSASVVLASDEDTETS